jgi:ribosomal protein L24
MNKNIETVTKLRTGDEVIVIAGKDMGKKQSLQAST